MRVCSAFDEEELQGILVQQSGSTGLTQAAFMSKWAYLTATNPRAALAHLLYIGIPLDKFTMQQQFRVSRPRSLERKRPREQDCRTTFQVVVCEVSLGTLLQLMRWWLCLGLDQGCFLVQTDSLSVCIPTCLRHSGDVVTTLLPSASHVHFRTNCLLLFLATHLDNWSHSF